MWSKFTEYAEGIVEIVAQADAAAAASVTDNHSPPLSSSSASSTSAAAAPSSITGEEIWSRFTSIVAPPAAAIAAAATAPLSQKREQQAPQSRAVEDAPRSAPPSLDQLRKAQTEAQRQTAVGKQQEPPSSSSKTIDEDEQEQYICELERALLQRKKQNEVFEKQVRLLCAGLFASWLLPLLTCCDVYTTAVLMMSARRCMS